MESNHLSHIHLVSDDLALPARLSGYAGAYCSFRFGPGAEEQTEQVFRHIFSQQQCAPFTLTLTPDDRSDTCSGDWLNKLCLLLCHPSYYRSHQRLLLGIAQPQGEPYSRFHDLVKSKLTAQGFMELTLHFRALQSGQSNCCWPDEPAEIFFDRQYQELLLQQPTRPELFVQGGTDDLLHWLEARQAAEAFFSHAQPLLLRQLLLLQKQADELQACKALMKRQGDELASKQAYLDFVMDRYKEEGDEGEGMGELMKIRKFYYHEYEVLPLWYKRMGHLLKVVMGKRTFRSLFDDSVKKYKA